MSCGRRTIAAGCGLLDDRYRRSDVVQLLPAWWQVARHRGWLGRLTSPLSREAAARGVVSFAAGERSSTESRQLRALGHQAVVGSPP